MSHTMIPSSTGFGSCQRRVRRLCLALVLGAVVFTSRTAGSAIYQYIEPNGTIAATNVPTDGRFQPTASFGRRASPGIPPRELDQAIRWFARQQKLSPALLRAVIKAESDFNPGAVSPTGAIGLMQLMPRTAASLKVRDPFNPVENIRGGARHLRYLLDRFDGDLPLAIAAYNAGEYRVKRNNYQIPQIEETQLYVEKVLFYYETFRATKRAVSAKKAMF